MFKTGVGHALRGGALVLAVLATQVGVGSALTLPVPPIVTSVAPSQGSVVGGEKITINGSGFVGPAGACGSVDDIWFGVDAQHQYTVPATSYQVLSDKQISVVVPASFDGPVNVRVHNSCGFSPAAPGDVFTYVYPSSQCLSGTCSVNVGSSPIETLRHAGVGFLDGFNTDAGVHFTPDEANLVAALHPRQWRLGQSGLSEAYGGVFGLARWAGAKISLDLTTDWVNWANGSDPTYAWTPYGDLTTYYNFIYNDVKQRMAANKVPDYFDVWNEPPATGTVNQWLSVYGTAYQAIKAADPSAQVVGPSLAQFLTASAGHGDSPGYDLSLSDFLNWEMSSGARFAAVTWHEDGTTVDAAPLSPGSVLPSGPDPGGYRDYWSPSAIATHITAAKALLAQYPSLNGTQVFVNEYGPTYAVNVPGWMVGDFVALETAGADEGMLTCANSAGCYNLLDGLIGVDGTPQMPYWVMQAYSQMSGSRVAVSGSPSNVYTLATRDDSTQTVDALIGRADDCFGGTECPQFHAVAAGPVNVSLSLSIPWAAQAVNVVIHPLPDQAVAPIGLNDVPSAPASNTISNVSVRGGVAQVTIPSVHDGDAFYVTATPAAAPTTQQTAGQKAAPKRKTATATSGATQAATTRTTTARASTAARRRLSRRRRLARQRRLARERRARRLALLQIG